MNWTKKLPVVVYRRLCECRTRREDLRTLVDVRWADMREAGKEAEGFTKEDALVCILDLLDLNGQWRFGAEMTRAEYDALCA